MIVSLNEIETSCYRAGLGIGLAQGAAEDAAEAAARLALAGHEPVAILLGAMLFAEAHPAPPPLFSCAGPVWRGCLSPMPAVVAGPALADLLDAFPGAAIDIAETDAPLLLAAYAADGAARVKVAGKPLAPLAVRPKPARFTVAEPDWRKLLLLAARTYVPATDRSRLMGAGAGLSDND